MLVTWIDAQGFYEAHGEYDGDTLPGNAVQGIHPEGLYKPRWDGTAWVEGETPEGLLRAAKARKKAYLRGKTTGLFSYLFPEAESQEEQVLRALYELYMQDPKGNLRRIRAGIEKLDTALAAVDAASTIPDVEAIDVTLDPTAPKEKYPERPPYQS